MSKHKSNGRTTKNCYFSVESSDTEEEEDDLAADFHLCEDNGHYIKNGSKPAKLSQPNLLTCTECQPVRYFSKLKVLELHKQYIHRKKKTFDCILCQQVFPTKNQLLVHQTLYGHKL